MKEHIELIGPVLRGLSYNEGKTKLVTYLKDKQKAEELVDVYKTEMLDITYTPSESDEEIIRLISDGFNNYTKRNNRQPLLIMINSTNLFVLGNSYKEICDIGECKFDINDTRTKENISDRNSIVKNKVSVVTGGAQGIGKEIVAGLAEAGSLVFIADINMDGAIALSEQLNEKYKCIVSFPVNVNIIDEYSVKEMVSNIVQKTGGIDIFVNNAGVLKANSVKEMSLKDFSFVSDVNYTGYFLCVKYVSSVMAIQNKISKISYTDIIQINSKSGLVGSKRNSAYAGSKFGGIGLTQSFALELVEDNIKVNSICPGNFFDGPLWSDPDKGLFAQYLKVGKVPGAKTFDDVKKFYESKVPMKRGCTGEDLMKAIFYVVDQKYETGQAIPVTGGQVMLK